MREDYDPLRSTVIGAAIYVHQKLGPGLLESSYEQCLTWALKARDVAVRRLVELPLIFEGHRLDAAYRIDLLVNESLIIEIKKADPATVANELVKYMVKDILDGQGAAKYVDPAAGGGSMPVWKIRNCRRRMPARKTLPFRPAPSAGWIC